MKKNKPVNLKEEEYKQRLRAETLKRVEGFRCRLFLFGSRIAGPVKRSSDFDIGVENISKEDFKRLRAKLEGIEDDLNLPHGVDIVNFETADEGFKRQATKNGIEVWKQG